MRRERQEKRGDTGEQESRGSTHDVSHDSVQSMWHTVARSAVTLSTVYYIPIPYMTI